MTVTETITDLARIAVLLEEFANQNGAQAAVVPASELDIDTATVTVSEIACGPARVLIAVDTPEPSLTATAVLSYLAEQIGTPTASNVNLKTLPDPAAVVVTDENGEPAAIVYLSPASVPQRTTPQTDDGLLTVGVLRHVPLEVTAELGRAKVTMENILQYQVGTVVELDRIAGSPVDLVVNGSLVARGEVVVVAEEYGVRITEIVGRT